MFSKTSAQIIDEVVGGFKKQIDRLGKGLEVLTQEQAKNNQEMLELSNENHGLLLNRKKAETLMENLRKLVGDSPSA